jgi:hypothetical protein
MITRATAIWLVLALGIGFGLFQLKYQVQGLEQKLAGINRQILDNEEAIHVLKAEWSYLNRPERIEALSRKFLELQPLSGKQYVSLDDVPLRPVLPVPTLPPDGAGPNAAPKAPLPPIAHSPAARPIGPNGGGIRLAREVQ